MTLTEQILSLLPPGHPWGQHLIHMETVDSTNTFAKNLAQQGAPAGTVIIADTQTGGRGRLGRSFSSPEGLGLYFSLILRPHCQPGLLMHLTCAVGVAATQAVRSTSGIAPGIKWTNDLIVGQRKLGGILTELGIDSATGLVDYAIVGIGINCLQRQEDFPPELQQMATSLALSGGRADRAALAAELIVQLSALEQNLLTEKKALMASFARHCVTIGQEVSIVRADQIRHGKAVGIDEDGALLVDFPDGSHAAISSGEVSIRGMYGYL